MCGWKSVWKYVKYCLKTKNYCLEILTKHPIGSGSCDNTKQTPSLLRVSKPQVGEQKENNPTHYTSEKEKRVSKRLVWCIPCMN